MQRVNHHYRAIPLFLFILALTSCRPQDDRGGRASSGPAEFRWQHATPESQGMSSEKLDAMKNVLAEKGTQKLLILKNDKIVYEWYSPDKNDDQSKHYTASLAKAIVSGMSLLAAMDDGYITPDEAACYYIPSWKDDPLKSKITIRQLATHTSGLIDAEGTPGEQARMSKTGLHVHFDLPGWRGQFWRKEPDPFSVARDSTPVAAIPGKKFAYSNPGIAMLTYAVTASLKDSPYTDIRTYLKKRIYDRIGMKEEDYSMGYGKTYDVNGLQLVPGWGGGNYTARAVARIGLLMLHKGNWLGKQIIDSAMVERVTRYAGTTLPVGAPDPQNEDVRSEMNPFPATTLGWYSNFDGIWPAVPRDAFAGGGAGNQHLIVIPSMNMVIVRMGDNLFDASKGEKFWLGAEKYLMDPVMDAVIEPPYPASDLKAHFAPVDSVIRLAGGSDNWPSTWADDGSVYTAYGDGYGFKPNTGIKLSLGFAIVDGNPPAVKAVNLRSHSGERVGQGKYGEKASGILMVDGVLYMLIRNAHNAKLMWSDDHGKTWETALWNFDVSFGCPAFLRYGKDYADARDGYVYIYSQDETSAYKNSDRFVLARVPAGQMKDWRMYTYFAGLDDSGNPSWTKDIRERESVFSNPGKCYRSGITYNKGLKRYLWCQTIQLSPSGGSKGPRYKGGLGIFESENPWGPWKTVYYTRNWDIGPGETSSIPTKWMSEDGRTAWLLFSGEDCFSLRKVRFEKRD